MNRLVFFLLGCLIVFVCIAWAEEKKETKWDPFNDYEKANELAEWSTWHIDEYTGLSGTHTVMRVRNVFKRSDSEIYFKFEIGIFHIY
jgi:hypothetical protein